MPVSLSMRQKRESAPDFASSVGLSHIDTTSILFGDDDEGHKDATTSPDVKSYLQANTTEDKFPILVRSNHKPGTVSSASHVANLNANEQMQLSASSAALDLASLQSPGSEGNAEPRTNGWPAFSRHRHSQHSMPQNNLEAQKLADGPLVSPSASSQISVDTVVDSPSAARQVNRHSMESTLASLAQKGAFGHVYANGSSSRPNLASLQSSYSTNDIPTLKGSNGSTGAGVVSPTANNQSSFHKHQASMGRVPAAAMNKRLSRDATSAEGRQEDTPNGVKQYQSDLQPNAIPFGPASTAISPIDQSVLLTSPGLQQFNSPAFYAGYGMSMLNMGINPMQIGTVSPYSNAMHYYQAQNPYGSFATYNGAGRGQDSQTRVVQQRRIQNAEGKFREFLMQLVLTHMQMSIASQMRRLTSTRGRSTRSARISMDVATYKSNSRRAIQRPCSSSSLKPRHMSWS